MKVDCSFSKTRSHSGFGPIKRPSGAVWAFLNWDPAENVAALYCAFDLAISFELLSGGGFDEAFLRRRWQ